MNKTKRHPWVVECNTNVPGCKGTICEVGYRPNALLIVEAVAMLADFKKIATTNPPAGVTFKQWVRSMADKHCEAIK